MKKRKNNLIESNFDHDEKFTINNIPKHFESVTNESIRDVKQYCTDIVDEKFEDYAPGALNAMLGAVDGAFEQAYVILIGDYTKRRDNLERVFAEGKTEVDTEIRKLPMLLAEHERAFKKYNEYSEKIYDCSLPDELKIKAEDINKMKNDLKELKNANEK